jgi:hypothetical protein
MAEDSLLICVTEELMIKQDAVNVFIEKQYMVIVEAKRTADIEKADSKAQLLAQIRSLQVQ